MSEFNKRGEHILSLIPKNQFHSCVLTTYSADFNFMNHKMQSQLSRAGIINTNILIDDNMLQKYLGKFTGYAQNLAKLISTSGIVCPMGGVFHPKIGLFFGENQGFMIIGSGNITTSGHGKNYELWAAFHINGHEDPKAILFKSAWNYLLNFSNQLSGISKSKIDWIEEFSGWINLIPDNHNARWISIGDNTAARLFSNSANSIWKSLMLAMEGEVVTEVTVISPFLDHNQQKLFELCEFAGSAEVHLIIQPNTYEVPYPENFEIPENLICHDWNTIDTFDTKRAVHAKLLYISTAINNYCLIGSANLTTAGMGTNSHNPKNEEFSILIRSKDNLLHENLLMSDRGKIIQFPCEGIERTRIDTDTLTSNESVRITGIEIENNFIFIFTKQIEDTTNMFLHMYDAWGTETDRINLSKANYSTQHEKYSLKIEQTKDIFFAQLLGKGRNVISNKVIVHNRKSLINTYPSKESRKLNKIILDMMDGSSDLTSLLKFITTDMITNVEKPEGVRSSGMSAETQDEEYNDGSGEKVGYDNFTEQSEQGEKKFQLYKNHNDLAARILEFFNSMIGGSIHQKEYHENLDEETDDPDNSQGREDNDTEDNETEIIVPESQFRNYKQVLENLFNKYINSQEVVGIDNSESKNFALRMYVIVLQIIIYYFKRPITVSSVTDSPKPQFFLDSCGEFGEKNDACQIIADVVGKHSIIMKTYGTESESKELDGSVDDSNDELKELAYWCSVFTIFLISNFAEDEDLKKIWIWELYMNIRFNTLADERKDEDDAIEQFSNLLKIQYGESEEGLEKNIIKFWNSYETAYFNFIENSEEKKGVSEEYTKVFTCVFDFCHICTRTAKGQGFKIKFARPGYTFCKDTNDYLINRNFQSDRTSVKTTTFPTGSED